MSLSVLHAERLKYLLKDSTAYGIAAAIQKSFSLITFPLLARHLSLSDYGIFDYLLTLLNFLIIFFTFGQDSAVGLYLNEYKDREERCQIVSQSLFFQVFLSMLFIFLALRTDILLYLLKMRDDINSYLNIILIQLPFSILIYNSQSFLRWNLDKARFLILSLGNTVIKLCSWIVAILEFNAHIKDILLVGLFIDFIFSFIGIYFIRKWITFPSNLYYLREILILASPYGIIGILSSLLPILERTVVESLLGLDALGLYSAGYKIAMSIGLGIFAFHTAWGPFAISLYKSPNAAYTYNLVLKIFSPLICIFVIFLTMIAQPIIKLLASDRYLEASIIIFPLTMGLAIQAISWITEIGIEISKRSYLRLFSNFSSIIAAFLAILLLTPRFGLLGVASGVLVGQAVRAAIASYLAQRAYPLPWQYAPALTIVTVTLLSGFTAMWAGEIWGYPAKLITLGIALVTVPVIGGATLFGFKRRYHESQAS